MFLLQPLNPTPTHPKNFGQLEKSWLLGIVHIYQLLFTLGKLFLLINILSSGLWSYLRPCFLFAQPLFLTPSSIHHGAL